MKSVNVVHLNAAGSGGAYVAAQRLNDALNHYEGVHSQHWIFEYQSHHTRRWANTYWKKWWAFLLHAAEKLDFLRFEKSKSVRFAFSHGKTGINPKHWNVIRNADVIHLHWINKGFISLQGLQELLEMGKPVVWTCHDMWPFTGGCYHPRGCDHFASGCGNCQYLTSPSDSDLSSVVFRSKSKLLSAESLHLVTPSLWLKSAGIRRSDLSLKHDIEVIPNPIDTGYFDPGLMSKSKLELRNAWKLPPNKHILLFISANLSNEKKGFAEFAALSAELERRQPGLWHAVVVGNRWPNHIQLPLTYTQTGLVNSTDVLKELYVVSDVYVTTSHEENLPTTVMEAQCMGLPVVAFAVGGIPEMVLPPLGYSGDILNVPAMADWLQGWRDCSIQEKAQISLSNRKHAISKYSQETVAEQYASLYLKALEHRKQ